MPLSKRYIYLTTGLVGLQNAIVDETQKNIVENELQ